MGALGSNGSAAGKKPAVVLACLLCAAAIGCGDDGAGDGSAIDGSRGDGSGRDGGEAISPDGGGDASFDAAAATDGGDGPGDGGDSPGDGGGSSPTFVGRFAEDELFRLDDLGDLHGHFSDDHRDVTVAAALPPGATFSAGRLTFSRRGGVVLRNPASGRRFYRIEVVLEDAGQSEVQAFLTTIDQLWRSGASNRGLSVGVDTAESPNTYWYLHTQLDETAGGAAAERSERWSRFVRRRRGDIRLEVYVTPAGIYPTIDGANLASFPNLALGSYTYRNEHPMNFIVLGKWDGGASAVSMRDLRVVGLDDDVSTAREANAHFIKKAMESPALRDLISDDTSFNGTGGFQNALWVAFLYRGYDHYFGGDHRRDVRDLFERYLTSFRTYVDDNVARYGREPTLNINHSFVNSIQWNPNGIFAIADYLTRAQIERARVELAKVIDAADAHILADGSFPIIEGFRGDTFAEEISWLLTFHAGYYALFPADTDRDRSERVLEMITFLGLHHMSTGESLASAYPALTFRHLGAAHRNFRSRYIFDDGSIDNHEFHPSLNYAIGVTGSAAVARNMLARRGVTVPTIEHNLDLAYRTSVATLLDPANLRLRVPLQRWNAGRTALVSTPDQYVMSGDGYVIDFIGGSEPSGVEDWASTYTSYNVAEAMGRYDAADRLATSVYFLYYAGAGRLFCGHVDGGSGQRCTMGTDNLYNYLFGTALYAMLTSSREGFRPLP